MRALNPVSAVALSAAATFSHGAGVVAHAQQISPKVLVDSWFHASELRWQGMAGGYDCRLRLIAVEGRLEPCGAGAFTNARLGLMVSRMLRGAALKMNGQVILSDSSRFSRVDEAGSLDRAVANCRASSTAVPRSEADFELDWPNGTFRN